MKNFKLALTGIAAIVGVVGLSASGVLAATSSTNVTVNAIIEEVLSVADLGDGGTGAKTVNLNATPGVLASNAADPHVIEIGTNSPKGYKLSIKDADANTNLVNGANTIAAHTSTFASPTALANNSWGYRTDQMTVGSYAGVTATDVTIRSSTGVVASETTNITYGVLVDASKPSGTYTDIVTITAVTNE